MTVLSGGSATDLFTTAASFPLPHGKTFAPRGMATRELVGVHLHLADTCNRLIHVPPNRGLNAVGWSLMERIAVIGCGGSGKSTIAKQLGALLDLRITYLDAIFYDHDWKPLPQDEFAAKQEKLVAGERWLIEGNYASTLPIRLAAADTVIFLDLPAVTCLWGILQRRWKYRGGQHHQDGVFDRITWNYVKYIWGYRKTMKPKVLALTAERGPHTRLVILSSRKAANRFLTCCAAIEIDSKRGTR